VNSTPVLFTLTWHLLLRHTCIFISFQAEAFENKSPTLPCLVSSVEMNGKSRSLGKWVT
jgi:hypothetical protein